MKVKLSKNLYDRNKKYYRHLEDFSGQNMSDYWKNFHSSISASFDDKDSTVDIGGYFNPIEKGTFSCLKYKAFSSVRRSWNSLETLINRFLRYSQPHSPFNFFPYERAYDLVFSMDKVIDHDDNPYRADYSRFRNVLFRSSGEIEKKWFLRDKFIPVPSDIRKFYINNIIRECIDTGRPFYHLEIGGGYGMLAAINAYYNKAKVVTVDLPVVGLFASIFLSYIFPEARILLPDEAEGTAAPDFSAYDFIFLTPGQAHLIPDNSIDLVTNICSMQEMNRGSIEEYFKLIGRVSRDKAVFICYNRVEKVPDRCERPVRFTEYPWDTFRSEDIFYEIDRFNRLIQPDPCFLRAVRIRK